MQTTYPVVAIIGRANVGKSSLFNRLTGRRQAITDDQPGTTRDPNRDLVHWNRHHFELIDTAGLKSSDDTLAPAIDDQIAAATDEADLIILVIDATTIITTEDQAAARLARKTGRPVILAVNKIDVAKKIDDSEIAALGIADVVPVSALHGTLSGELLDRVTKHLDVVSLPERELPLRVALLGRPNVGKSSLLNALIGKQQALVAAAAGTTRDLNRASIRYHDSEIELIDTAGLRRRGKITPGVEKFSTLRTARAIAESDICILLLDATELGAATDQHIAGQVLEAGKGLILAVNKWDLVDKDDKTQDRLTRSLQREFQFAWWAPLVFVSAAIGQNITKLFDLAVEIHKRRATQIPTPQLNRVLATLVSKHPPAGIKNHHPKLNYITQVATAPPVLVIFANYPQFIHFSYRRYLENGLREAFDFTGTPVKLEFRAKHPPRA